MKKKALKVSQLLKNAETAFAKQDPELALRYLQQAVSQEPSNYYVIDAFAEGLLYIGDIDTAKAQFLHAHEVAPFTNVGRYMYLGQFTEGIESLSFYNHGVDAIQKLCSDPSEQSPLLVSAYLAIAELYLTDLCFEENAENECEKYLTLAQQLDPNNPEVYLSLCSFRLSQKNEEDARNCLTRFDQICALDPSEIDPNSKLNAAKLHLELNNTELAMEYSDQILELDDSNIDALIVCTTALAKEEDYEEAKNILEKAVFVAHSNDWPDLIEELNQLRISLKIDDHVAS
ncbi:hypothetical protein RCL1_005340 [Eukaryota sp. TZLM3-RCL]